MKLGSLLSWIVETLRAEASARRAASECSFTYSESLAFWILWTSQSNRGSMKNVQQLHARIVAFRGQTRVARASLVRADREVPYHDHAIPSAVGDAELRFIAN